MFIIFALSHRHQTFADVGHHKMPSIYLENISIPENHDCIRLKLKRIADIVHMASHMPDQDHPKHTACHANDRHKWRTHTHTPHVCTV